LHTGIDILENEIIEQYPAVFQELLRDHTTQKNIFWATENYQHLGEDYSFNSEILPELISGDYGSIIMPRVHKNKILQQSRAKEMAEVFTPSWICNAQNNLIDNAWFGRNDVFNFEIAQEKAWQTNLEKIDFPEGKTWKDYICDTRLEIACGEAPYITSRYDSTTGEFIPIQNRIGLLDRKLRVINENVDNSGDWLKAAQVAYKSIYAFEWQGDSLLLAREAMLATFIENYYFKFKIEPLEKSILHIANIISWNVWQMDGLKGVLPSSCGLRKSRNLDAFDLDKLEPCLGCKSNDIKKHNGTYSLIIDWNAKDPNTGNMGKKMKFVDLINKKRK
jgi:hypothetical protein